MRDRILRYLMIPLTIGILAYSAAYLAREYTKVDPS